MNNNFCVYKHTFPNGKVYIGVTGNEPKKRWLNGEGYRGQSVYDEIKKYGWKNIKHEVIVRELDELQALAVEEEITKAYGEEKVYNKRYVAASPLKGKKPTRVYPPKQTFTINGVTKAIDEWCRIYNVPRCRVSKNIKTYNLTPLQALTFPPVPSRGGWNRKPLEYWKMLGLLPEDYSIDKVV